MCRFLDGVRLGGSEFGCKTKAYFSPNSPLITDVNARRLWAEWAKFWNPYANNKFDDSKFYLHFEALNSKLI